MFVFRVGGTVAAVVTCPLEVVKTRLQVTKLISKFLQTISSNVANNYCYLPLIPVQYAQSPLVSSKEIL